MIEVLIVDREGLGVVEGDLGRALVRLCALGVDIVVVGEPEADRGALLGITGPGRVYAWSGEPPAVVEVGGDHSTAPALRQPVAGEGPRRWAQRRLGGIGRPAAVAETRHPSAATLADMAAALSGLSAPVDEPEWRIDVDGRHPARERSFESWFTVGNGRSGTRGTSEEGYPEEYPATYVAGVFGVPDGSKPELVRGPEWPRLWASRNEDTAGSERRVLDMRQGVFMRRRGGQASGEVELRSARLAPLADRELMFIEAESPAPEGGAHGAPAGPAVAPATVPGDQGAVEAVRVKRAGEVVVVTVDGSAGGEAAFAISTRTDGSRVSRLTAVGRLGAGAKAAGTDPSTMAVEALARAEASGPEAVKASHRRAWRQRWRDSDVVVGGAPDAQRALRFSLYHLISSGDPESDLASIGARGLTGPGYRGHVFWDTEVFVLPFFIWTHPATARALLAYRYRTLPAARAKAVEMGYEGALFAWESADTGEECTPAAITLSTGEWLEVHTGAEEHHISADVAWAVWEYWKVSADDGFLVDMGAEIIIETARFWASRAVRGDDGRMHICGVIGPDEYHEHIDDNAFTNVMARWNLLRASRLCEMLPGLDSPAWQSLVDRIGLADGESRRWVDVAGSLVDGFDPETGVYEQFAGFHKLENLRAIDLAPRPFTAEAVVGVERLRDSQVVKQADVVMLARMLPDEVPPDVAAANYRYYEPLTCHGSSLSPAIHAVVAARVGALEDASGYFAMASGIDLDDRMGNASEGVHIATMGGLWQAAVLGFGGVRADGDVLRIDPCLPPGWDSLSFPIQWRGTRVDVAVDADGVEVDLDGPVDLALGSGPSSRIGPGRFSCEVVTLRPDMGASNVTSSMDKTPDWRPA